MLYLNEMDDPINKLLLLAKKENLHTLSERVLLIYIEDLLVQAC